MENKLQTAESALQDQIRKLKNENFRLQDAYNCEIEINRDLERKIDNLLKEEERYKETIYKLIEKLLNI